MGTVITFLFIQMVHGMDILWVVISMRLPDSASIFTDEVWAIIEALEQIKDSVVSKYIIFTDSLSCLQALQYMKLDVGTSLDWDGDTKVCLFKFCQ